MTCTRGTCFESERNVTASLTESFCKRSRTRPTTATSASASDIMVRDQVIFGTNNADLRELMLGQRNLTMAKVEELCRAADDGVLGNHVLGNSDNNDPNFRKRRIRKRRTGHFGPECTAGPVVIEDALENSDEHEDCKLFGWFHPDFFKGFGAFDDL
ncbi:uncharacterized protein LOC125943256 [Dermacentor silvarum]|uniref:uncharacterized protein LOC125943256 n=1 Tax=Dermacentor silvarum TaxID=543639 RepID=UPI002100969F|nr:uncharacterized protein LOC125943256 [Dermacentor silvarum]